VELGVVLGRTDCHPRHHCGTVLLRTTKAGEIQGGFAVTKQRELEAAKTFYDWCEMTFEELDQKLPNGFHDAKIRTITLDFVNRSIVIGMNLLVGVGRGR
jgi:hypothetical protein